MKHLYTFLLLIIPILTFAQCPDTPIVLSSQADVDNFTTNYPGCTQLFADGDWGSPSLLISGDDIIDLSPISSVEIVQWLEISDNPILETLDGLNILEIWDGGNASMVIGNNESLTDISALNSAVFLDFFGDNNEGYVAIGGNPSLLSLEGLNGLTTSYFLNIINNDALTDLSGLENLQYALEFSSISNNELLINFSGMNSLQVIGNMDVINNQSLQNFIGLSTFYSLALKIEDNPSLENLSGLEGMTNGNLWLENNAIINDISAISSTIFDPENTYEVYIKNNPNLSVCDIPPICTAVNQQLSGIQWYYSASTVFHEPIIQNNAAGCEDNLEVFINCGETPLNDDCNDIAILTYGQTLTAVNELATTSANVPSCNDIDRADVWFKFNFAIDLVVDIIVDEGYNLQLWQGSCSSLTQVADACGSDFLNDIPVLANTSYYVQVWSSDTGRYSNRATGLFNITLQDGTLSTEEVTTEEVSIYPNPVNELLYFNARNNVEEINVYDLIGQLVASSKPNTLKGSIDMSKASSGMYLVKVQSNNSETTTKIIKQ